MLAPIACVKQAWRPFGRLGGSQASAWFWAWSWGPLKFMRRHPPHHLSPARQITRQGRTLKRALAAPSRHGPSVSASKNSVPDSDIRDGFDDWVVGLQFVPVYLHHPVLPNHESQGRASIGRFCGHFRRHRSALPVSGGACPLSSRFSPPLSTSKHSIPL